MAKIAMIGAGSMVFCKTLSMDILATEALAGSELCLMSRTRPKLDRMEAFIKRVIAENKCDATVWSTLERREALAGADYVIIMIPLEVERVDVPLDPALAIAHRFSMLAEQKVKQDEEPNS